MRFQTKNFHEFKDFPPELLGSFKSLYFDLFSEEWDAKVEERFKGRKRILFQLAYGGDNEVYGFKFGYEDSVEVFYSWLGGVKVTARNYGIASSLMFAQHDWCKANGYKKITTKTLNKFKPMLIMNIRNGFDVVGTEPDAKFGCKILLEKGL